MSKLKVLAIVMSTGLACLLLGYVAGTKAVEPEIIIVTEKEYLTVTVTEYVPVEFEVIREVPVEVEIPHEYRLFTSIEELEEYRDTELLVKISGKWYRMPTDSYSEKEDCDDVAEAWQRKILEDGFLVSQQIINKGYLLGIKVSETKNKHVGIWTMIGNDAVFMDTYSPYKVVDVANRD